LAPAVALAVSVVAVAVPSDAVGTMQTDLGGWPLQPAAVNTPEAPLDGAAKVTDTPAGCVLPYASFTVTLSAVVKAVLTTADWASPAVFVTVDGAAGLTVTGRVPELLLIVPSPTVMLAVSALTSVILPLFAPDTLATPLANVIAVAEPKAIAAPDAFVTVGLNVPIELAPPNVRA
jgi:hypothetical protein